MLYQGLGTLEALTGATNYNTWIVDNFSPYIQAPLLEFGAGIGNISDLISLHTPLCLTDTDARMLAHLEAKFAESANIAVNYLDITQAPPKHMLESFQTVIGINVLEHIEDDEMALRHLGQLLQPSGRLLLLVPAKKWAYTKLDKQIGHFRRYERKELREKLAKESFHVEKLYFVNIVGLVAWIVRDKIRLSGALRSNEISLFDVLVPVLRRIEAIIPMPLGISLIAVAQKREQE